MTGPELVIVPAHPRRERSRGEAAFFGLALASIESFEGGAGLFVGSLPAVAFSPGDAGAGCCRLHGVWQVAGHGEAVERGLRAACTAVATVRAYSVAPGGRGCTSSSQSRPVRCSMVANQLASTTL